MATPTVLRSIIHEIKHTLGDRGIAHDTPVARYLMNQYRVNQVTQQQKCRAVEEMDHLAGTYLTYLRSTRVTHELRQIAKGKGEMSPEDAANRVGLSMPIRKPPNP